MEIYNELVKIYIEILGYSGKMLLVDTFFCKLWENIFEKFKKNNSEN